MKYKVQSTTGVIKMQIASSGLPTSGAMQGGEALAANLAKGVQEIQGQVALALLASTAQLPVSSNPVGSTGSVIGQHINISV
ncbi:MAG: hypothetical protein ACJAZB_000304 [Psychrosphaera sp.]|nr:hypothetical protein [Psychrosphaera sp. F3M07]